VERKNVENAASEDLSKVILEQVTLVNISEFFSLQI